MSTKELLPPAAEPGHCPRDLTALRYGARELDGRSILASDPPGGARVVEGMGDLGTADHVAVLVPGNGHHLGNYFVEDGRHSPRVRGERLLRTMRTLDPGVRAAVVVWVGYHAPSGLAAATLIHPAQEGAPDLVRLTDYLPRAAHVTVIGHSYGSTVSGLALTTARVDDHVSLGSPGLGVWRRDELRPGVRLWAGRSESDWIRFFPRVRLGALGLGRDPFDLGATRFGTGDVGGHSGYFDEGSESLLNITRIALGRFGDVTAVGPQPSGPARARRTGAHSPREAVIA